MYEAITDCASTILHYRSLAEIYPESKYILTVRDEETWLESFRKHLSNEKAFTIQKRLSDLHRMAVYGSTEMSEHLWLHRYRKHNEEVQEFFAGTNRLLVMNVIEGDGWEKLCPFVNHSTVPKEPFPHRNKSK
jgi:predicted dithiol-disulfide oxidoreductase (DUF899 family)